MKISFVNPRSEVTEILTCKQRRKRTELGQGCKRCILKQFFVLESINAHIH